ncbi:metal-transporting ATPase [Paramagnetospirillum marisnigri]|uniref:Metal-transporting ATPase n=1 Tax=Paramagnetospirillum marisnigri TaxID=1285242 RepID=A0A178MP91_9PROT|nr:metal-transporting ATPase [Paramagnetospirillum marisnigri]
MNHATEVKPWHSQAAAEVLAALGSDGHGLGEEEAARRLASHGPNRLPEHPPRPAWAVFLDQFRNLLTLMLLGAGLLAGLIGDVTDMVAVLAVTAFNAVLGFVQERRAERILATLKSMLAQQARIRRGGQVRDIPAEALVPGDLVLLEAGDRIPADGRLILTRAAMVDESALTGESLPVDKQAETISAAAAPLGDRLGMAFMNTVMTAGRAEMVVTETGGATEMGRIAHLLATVEAPATPLQQRLDALGRRLALVAAVVVAVVALQGWLRGETAVDILLTAVALAVAAIPEGLPAVVTVTLAIGMFRMARRGAIVRRLSAVETLGSTTVICSDKTGTLTMNRMTALAGWARGRRFGEADMAEMSRSLLVAALCNDARLGADGVASGDPTEAALLVLAARADAVPPPGEWQRRAELPFDSARKLMATIHDGPEGPLLSVKGAPDVVAALCVSAMGPEGEIPLDAESRRVLDDEIAHMAGQALRVMALASRPVASGADPAASLDGLCLQALVGLADPPRPGVKESVAACHQAGIAVKMITGDHAVTAAAIATQLGIMGKGANGGEVVTGADLDRMAPEELARRVGAIAVFARVAPEHKVRIVEALKADGQVIAMTGDGVNDAAALKSAHLGVAMGRSGSDVTREAAAMVLTDDDFSTVVRAVREGRTIADNIVKFLRFQLSTNMGALLAVLAAPLFGLPLPFGAIQILWVNIIMDGPPAMALAFDPPRRGAMREPPRDQDQPILGARRLARLAWLGGLMAAGTLAALHLALAAGQDTATARSLAFTTFVLFQVVNVFNARVGRESALGRMALANGKLWLTLAAVLALQAVVVHWSVAQALFHTRDLSLDQWLLAAGLASLVLVAEELRKLLMRGRV